MTPLVFWLPSLDPVASLKAANSSGTNSNRRLLDDEEVSENDAHAEFVEAEGMGLVWGRMEESMGFSLTPPEVPKNKLIFVAFVCVFVLR